MLRLERAHRKETHKLSAPRVEGQGSPLWQTRPLSRKPLLWDGQKCLILDTDLVTSQKTRAQLALALVECHVQHSQVLPPQKQLFPWRVCVCIMYIQAHLCYGMHGAFRRQSQELVLCRQSCVGSHQAWIQMPLLTEPSRCLVSNFILLKITEGAEGIYPVKSACLACFNSILNTQKTNKTPKSYCLSLLKEVKTEILKYFFNLPQKNNMLNYFI